jgi:hypothetical protein
MNTGNGKNPTGVGPGPRAPTPTMTNGRNTRQSSQLQPPTREEIISMDYMVKDAQSGAAYLTKNSLSPMGEPLTLENLTTALFHILQLKGVNRPASEAIRAIAYLLEKELTTKIAEAVASQISTDLSREVVSHILTAIAPHMATFHITNEALSTNVSSLENIKTAVDSINTGCQPSKTQWNNSPQPSRQHKTASNSSLR